MKKGKNYIPNLSLLSLRLGGITSPEKTADGYELRSRGPASRGFDALDNSTTPFFSLENATAAILERD
jgi:hypothetical protein